METHTKRPEEKQVASAVGGRRRPVLRAVLPVVGAVLIAGCPKKPEVRSFASQAAAPAPVAVAKAGPREVQLQDVFFATSQAELSPDARQTLEANIGELKANPDVRVTIEGHTDERGTPEYNRALGDRRATAVRDYLVAGGIDSTRISTLSYGKERPFVLGTDESAWKWNRRGHFVAAQ